MSGSFVGRLDHIIGTIADTGFTGVEPETQFLGELEDPARLAATLTAAGVEMAALTLVEDWLGAEETDAERQRADACQALLGHFPNTLLNLCQMPTTRPSAAGPLRERQDNLLSCVNAIARRFHDSGTAVGYHPNSPATSIYRTAGDYTILLDGLDAAVVGWIPDVGHMAAAGIDPLPTIQAHRTLVNHIHYKDMDADRNWVEMGGGVIDFHGITAFLVETGFDGWIVVEDESDRAVPEPDAVTRDDWEWVERELVPIVAGSPL
jgi:inosose dehydratase